MNDFLNSVTAIEWRDGALHLLDQRVLPLERNWLRFNEVEEVARAIADMVVRGAPAIGVTAAYGVVLAARSRYRENPENWRHSIEKDFELLARSRPTAVNLFWALEEMKIHMATMTGDPETGLLATAQRIHRQDVDANQRMGEFGAQLLGEPTSVLTHCNAGALATGGFGTALGVVRAAYRRGWIRRVYADETRPWLQGSRLTAWELLEDGIPVTLIADGAAAHLLHQGEVGWIIVGADRIAANGDTANKIGTYGLAVLARHHGLKTMVVAPTSTIDMTLADGLHIPIEQRSEDEVLNCAGRRVAAVGAEAWNPVFDVTPAHLIDAIVTEKGVVRAPDANKIKALMNGSADVTASVS